MLNQRKLVSGLGVLKANTYPGRVIIMGLDQGGRHVVQIAAIMGRSPGSRNRVYVEGDNGLVKTALADPSKERGDPALTIYNAMLEKSGSYVVSNGHQTDAVLAACLKGRGLRAGLNGWETEPDDNHTPRVTAFYRADSGLMMMGINRLDREGKETCDVWSHEDIDPHIGVGYCFHTYVSDGKPLPSFRGRPYHVPLDGGIDDVARLYWDTLNEENRVALAVKFIPSAGGDPSEVRVINKYEKSSGM